MREQAPFPRIPGSATTERLSTILAPSNNGSTGIDQDQRWLAASALQSRNPFDLWTNTAKLIGPYRWFT